MQDANNKTHIDRGYNPSAHTSLRQIERMKLSPLKIYSDTTSAALKTKERPAHADMMWNKIMIIAPFYIKLLSTWRTIMDYGNTR